MRDAAPQTIYLADYTPYGFIIDDVALHFDLDPRKTRVKSRISFRPNPDASDKTFFLHGENLWHARLARGNAPWADLRCAGRTLRLGSGGRDRPDGQHRA